VLLQTEKIHKLLKWEFGREGAEVGVSLPGNDIKVKAGKLVLENSDH